ncbi:unnamed protein product [Cochlearia groenlandica]
MKVMKAMKKLKFWSRKKRKRKHTHQCSCEYSSPISAVEPTAPPLPFWFDETQSLCEAEASTFHSNTKFSHKEEETIVEEPLSQETDIRVYPSYQQYMVPNPSFGGAIVDSAQDKRSVGIFGCVIEFSSNVVHCFFPCFSN